MKLLESLSWEIGDGVGICRKIIFQRLPKYSIVEEGVEKFNVYKWMKYDLVLYTGKSVDDCIRFVRELVAKREE